jgi:hypothetical protein
MLNRRDGCKSQSDLPDEQSRRTNARRLWTWQEVMAVAGSNGGAERAALNFTLIMSAEVDDIEPHARLSDVLVNIAHTPINMLKKLLPCPQTCKTLGP